MENNEQKQTELLTELGAELTRSRKGSIYTLTIIGQVEGHQVLPENAKTTNTRIFCRSWPTSRRARRSPACCSC